jgi:hypothetical protein
MLRVALYRAKFGNLMDDAINAFSGLGGFSHAEIVFSDGVSFSSTQRDDLGIGKAGGTRYKTIDYDANPDRWLLIEIPCTPEEEAVVRSFCDSELGCGYDYAGCVRFVLPFWKAHDTEWFCSEVVVAALQHLWKTKKHLSWGFFVRTYGLRKVRPERVSPNRLFDLLGAGDALFNR